MLAFSELLAGHITKEYIQEQYVIDHIIEDYDLQHHVTTEDHMKNHLEE